MSFIRGGWGQNEVLDFNDLLPLKKLESIELIHANLTIKNFDKIILLPELTKFAFSGEIPIGELDVLPNLKNKKLYCYADGKVIYDTLLPKMTNFKELKLGDHSKVENFDGLAGLVNLEVLDFGISQLCNLM